MVEMNEKLNQIFEELFDLMLDDFSLFDDRQMGDDISSSSIKLNLIFETRIVIDLFL